MPASRAKDGGLSVPAPCLAGPRATRESRTKDGAIDNLTLLQALGTALLLGLLIGLERGWSMRDEPAGHRVAGFRTFGLLGLAGGMVGILNQQVGPWAAAALLLGALAILVAGFFQDMKEDGGVSATSAMAALLTICVGILAVSGAAPVAAGMAAAIALLLVSRRPLHAWVAKLSDRDVRATARFVILSAVILPLLPDERFGYLDAWNPRELWLVVVLVTGFSFAGYVAARALGRRGLLITAALGGLYSSTAVTAAFARRLRDSDDGPVLVAGISLASTLMFLRVLVLTAIFAPEPLPQVAIAILPAAATSALATLWLTWRSRRAQASGTTVEIPRNPLELLPALGFAGLVAMLALAVRWAETRFGDAGIATLIAISGSFDVDAAIVTVGTLPPGTLDTPTAALALIVPVILNMAFKILVVLVLAGWRRGWRASLPLVLGTAVVAATALLSLA